MATRLGAQGWFERLLGHWMTGRWWPDYQFVVNADSGHWIWRGLNGRSSKRWPHHPDP